LRAPSFSFFVPKVARDSTLDAWGGVWIIKPCVKSRRGICSCSSSKTKANGGFVRAMSHRLLSKRTHKRAKGTERELVAVATATGWWIGMLTLSNQTTMSFLDGMAAALNNTLVSEQIDTSVWRSTSRPLQDSAAAWRKSIPIEGMRTAPVVWPQKTKART
jgi:hypothetical protein